MKTKLPFDPEEIATKDWVDERFWFYCKIICVGAWLFFAVRGIISLVWGV